MISELSQLEDLNTNRITRILTTDFPQYFAIVSRIRQEVHAIGPEGITSILTLSLHLNIFKTQFNIKHKKNYVFVTGLFLLSVVISDSILLDFELLDCSNLFLQRPGLPGGLEFKNFQNYLKTFL